MGARICSLTEYNGTPSNRVHWSQVSINIQGDNTLHAKPRRVSVTMLNAAPPHTTFPSKLNLKRNAIPPAYSDSATHRFPAETSPYLPESCSSLFSALLRQLPSRPVLAYLQLLLWASTARTRSRSSPLQAHTHSAANTHLRHLSACCCPDLCAAGRYSYVCILYWFAGSLLAATMVCTVVAGRGLSGRILVFDEGEGEGEAWHCLCSR